MEEERKHQMKLGKALVSLVAVIAVMFVSMVKFGADPQIPLTFSCLVAGLVALWAGFRWEEILEGALKGISNSLEAILILLLIGVLVGSWIACGTVPAMILYGLQLISARTFLPAAMVICVIVAFAIGSWGTVGTVGLAFMGMGLALQLPAPVIAGCIVSGAYMGEVISPLSDATNLAAAVVSENVFDIIRKMIPAALAALIIALAGYFILGTRYSAADQDVIARNIGPLTEQIRQQFFISPVVLIPMALMAVCIFLKIPAIPSMFAGILSGVIIGMCTQGLTLEQVMDISYNGYVCRSGNEMVDQLLSAGGMEEMLYTISIIVIAMGFGGIMQATGQIEVLLRPLVSRIRSRGTLRLQTVIACILSNLVLPDQYLGISLPGQMYGKTYNDKGIDRTELASVLLGGGAVTSPMIPWNTCGIYVATILSVSPTAYGPYAFFCIALPVVVSILGFFGKKEGRK